MDIEGLGGKRILACCLNRGCNDGDWYFIDSRCCFDKLTG